MTLQNLDDDIKNLLQKRAEAHGRSLEEEAKEILRTVLIENQENTLNLASVIERRFAHFVDFELPDIPKEPLREPPMVCFQTLRSPPAELKKGGEVSQSPPF
ncbi:FitA-like ribbon-helix-helix domain-containing protein [Crinalium epipsammum]|uniref:FitA-like ribbon-helix-helix domain-containing protein n=1 Tax=Crinalium epipsammum TaxID=241425 RepID=UPI0036F423CC